MTATTAPPKLLRRRSFPSYRQHDAMDCGPTCLRMVAKHYGRPVPLALLREKAHIDRQGVSMLGIASAAESIGFRTLSAKVPLDVLLSKAPLPCVLHWDQNHFVVLYGRKHGQVQVADPARGRVKLSLEELREHWVSLKVGDQEAGLVLLLEPTPQFFAELEGEEVPASGIRRVLGYVRGYRPLLWQVGLGMLLASILQLIFPFLTQAVVDNGIANQNLSFVNAVLIAQLALVFSRTAVEFIRGRIVFHVGSRVYLSLLSDFLLKMMRLPVSFFDTRQVGDILQRVNDHSRVQFFITGTSLSALYSLLSLTVFTAVLAYYSLTIVTVFLIGTALYVVYVAAFLRRRKELDYRRFTEMAAGQNALMEIIDGMPEIKLANAEQQRRWVWESVQARLFRVNLRELALEQYQQGGGVLLNEMKNLTVTFLAARAVIEGEMTLGMLLAVQFIVGALNAPVAQLIGFIQSGQDAKISLDRVGEIHARENEEDANQRLDSLPAGRTLSLQGVTFGYGGPLARPVLDGLDLEIPEGKVTAIVGPSGSGKTTLLKLLVKFHEPREGRIVVGSASLQMLSAHAWRARCGVVMQDGHLFSDTISGNVAVGFESVDTARLLDATRIARVDEFAESLPLGYQTRIGRDGIGLSTGQKQRILIARALYKNPEYLFFDEATSALDATNERAIMERLEEVFRGRTVVVIAHRLSTVKRADQIVVLDGGRIVERGTHTELTELRGRYFELVRNQLEMGTE